MSPRLYGSQNPPDPSDVVLGVNLSAIMVTETVVPVLGSNILLCKRKIEYNLKQIGKNGIDPSEMILGESTMVFRRRIKQT